MTIFRSMSLNHGDSKKTWTSKGFENSRKLENPTATREAREVEFYYLTLMDQQSAQPKLG